MPILMIALMFARPAFADDKKYPDWGEECRIDRATLLNSTEPCLPDRKENDEYWNVQDNHHAENGTCVLSSFKGTEVTAIEAKIVTCEWSSDKCPRSQAYCLVKWRKNVKSKVGNGSRRDPPTKTFHKDKTAP